MRKFGKVWTVLSVNKSSGSGGPEANQSIFSINCGIQRLFCGSGSSSKNRSCCVRIWNRVILQ